MLVDTHKGPNPGITAIVYIVLLILSLVTYFTLSDGSAYPMPMGPVDQSQDIFLRYPHALLVHAFFGFASAFPLGLFTAGVTSRLSFLGVRATGVSIAFFGGLTASLFVALSSISTWVLSQPGIAVNREVLHAFQLFGFLNGGPAFAVSMGLLMAGVSVPALLLRLTPRWMAILGLVMAAIGVLCTLSLVFFPMVYLLPAVRFGSMIWMIAVGFSLPKRMPVHA
jgi:hypothetical protein